MNPEDLARRLRTAFLQELGDHVEALNQNLLRLEKAEKTDGESCVELLNALFRSSHTLKGAARSAGIWAIETAAHHLESILSRFRETGSRPDNETFRLLFPAIDAIEEAGAILKAEGQLAEARIEKMLPILERAAQGEVTGPALEIVPKPASSSPSKEKRSSVPSALLSRKSRQSQVSTGKQDPNETVRVPALKLDSMLGASGQLLSVCEEIAGYGESLRELRGFVQGWKNEWWSTLRSTPNGGGLDLKEISDRILKLESRVRDLSRVFVENRARLTRTALDLDQEIHRFRLFPFADACNTLERTVRDLATASGKEVLFRIYGGETELDRSVLESLKGPLLHLVRNAVDHGVESPEERRAAGKPLPAVITVRAQLLGDRIEVVVEDDGRGIDEQKIRASRNRRDGEADGALNLLDLLSQPGFSTMPIITEVSGRGVGLDAAKKGIESIGGRMELSTTPGTGSRFTLIVPLTITTLRVVLVRAGDQTFALQTHAVEKMVRLGRDAIRSVEGRDLVMVNGAPVPVWPIHALLGMEESSASTNSSSKVAVLILSSGAERVGLAVDEFIDIRQVVAKKLGKRLGQLPLISGATLLVGGKIALILNAAGLIRQTRLAGQARRLRNSAPAPRESVRKRVIYAEDSPTTRSLVCNILASHGYEVLTAVDGKAGWERLQQDGADLVISDVDMPNMTGIQLAETIRRSRRFRDVPIVLVTAKATDRDKKRGMEAGANAYIVKGDFDQTCLLETLDVLLS